MAQNGFANALDILGPFWGGQQLTLLQTHFEGNMSWVNYQSSLGNIVDRFRWEAGCIVEHVSDLPSPVSTVAGSNWFKWDQGEQFPDVAG
ncbi:hypothetical protein IMZ48_19645 [Candidatus Bathyarchaeota archaeon]|nr:hypothetical protein [Candidatus Bathyarchaeota archaeon]